MNLKTETEIIKMKHTEKKDLKRNRASLTSGTLPSILVYVQSKSQRKRKDTKNIWGMHDWNFSKVDQYY